MPKRQRSTVPFRNRSPFGWWTATYLERFEWYGSKSKRRLVWENTLLIKAKDRELAFRRAEKHAQAGRGEWSLYGDPPGRKGRWVYVGLTELLPIYEELSDGAEILWKEHRGMTSATLSKRVKTKSHLAVFDDTSDA